MKRMTDKDLRLYARLSDIDSDLILDSAVTAAPTPVKARGRRMETVWRVFSNPMVASLAMSTVMITLLLVVLLATGAFKTPTTTEPPAHGSYPEETTPPLLAGAPTAEAAESLRKGMSLDELESLMGSDYTVDGDCYTFTLDTGEKLTVSLAPDTSLVSGFAWLGETAKTVNPMNIPEDILQKIQEYASDKVVPVYTMDSLFAKYNRRDLPTVDEVLEGTEIRYLRMSADGESVVLDEEGHSAGGAPETVDFDWLTRVSALFDESVKVKEYYPILSIQEQGSVYFRTSIGDYILYLHSNSTEPLNNWSELTSVTPYLLPVVSFHELAYGVVADDTLQLQWTVLETKLPLVEHYQIASENYKKPVNPATPEAVGQIETEMEHSAVVELLGICLRCAAENTISLSSYARTSIVLPTYYKEKGLHYWELTDGTCLAINCIGVYDSSQSWNSGRFWVSDIMRLDAPELAEAFGSPSLANCGLLAKGMSQPFVRVIMGETLDTSDHVTTYADWGWVENGKAHTLTVTWNTEDWEDISQNATRSCAASFAYESRDVSQAAEEIEFGMSYRSIVARLGNCLCGHTADDWTSGYHFWALPDGRCLAAYMGVKATVYDDPFGVYVNMPSFTLRDSRIALHLLWLDSASDSQTVGEPSLSGAAWVEHGMEERVLTALMGAPTVTEESLFSVWEWNEEGKTYTLTVYWKNNRSRTDFNTVARYEINDGPLHELPIPDKVPTSADAQKVTEGITASELLRLMGSKAQATTGVGYTYYIWKLSDGRAFCAVTEDDVLNPEQTERIVTYTYLRDSMQEMNISCAQNMETVTEGMSLATVVALLGTKYMYEGTFDISGTTWCTSTGVWWDLQVDWEIITYPETGKERVYASSVTIIK